MTVEGRWLGFGALVLLCTAQCAPRDPGEPPKARSAPVIAEDRVADAGDEAFLLKAFNVVLGRAPEPGKEWRGYIAVIRRHGRSHALSLMMATPDYVNRWSDVFLDRLRVSRERGGGRTRSECWSDRTAASPALAEFIRNAPDARGASMERATGGVLRDGFTMRDVIEASIRYDDLLAIYRANLFSTMVTPLRGSGITEANIRADFWTRFESTYLNRQQTCLKCHNSYFSVADAVSGYDRHWPLPFKLEEATFGSNDAREVQSQDLHSDFRHAGAVNVAGATRRPWGMSANCGTFGEPSTEDPGLNFVPQLEDGSTAPARAPRPVFAAASAAAASVFRLDEVLARGARSIREAGLCGSSGCSDPAPRVMPDAPSASSADRAFAYLVAANIVDIVWEEVYGGRLTVGHGFSRTMSQGAWLEEATHNFLAHLDGKSWSLSRLLKQLLDRPDFNRGLGGDDSGYLRPATEPYPMRLLYDPWVAADPRDYTTYAPNDCATSPTFYGCIQSLLRKNECFHCHEGREELRESPVGFRHDDLASIRRHRTDTQSCFEQCGLPSEECRDLEARDGSELYVRVACARPERRMPRAPYLPLSSEDANALRTWVVNGAPAGVPPSPSGLVPPLAQRGNGVGDLIAWKSSQQLTSHVRSALGWPSSGSFHTPGVGYPTERLAEASGQYLSDTRPGGRGQSFPNYLEWDAGHRVGDADCVWPPPPAARTEDVIDRLARAAAERGAPIETAVQELKDRMLPDPAYPDRMSSAERGAITGVLGLDLSAIAGSDVSADELQQGLRKLCSVFLKTPQLLLTYLPPLLTPSELPPELLYGELLESSSLVRWPIPLPDGCLPPDYLSGTPLGTPKSDPNCPEIAFAVPGLCASREDCRAPVPLLDAMLSACWTSGSACSQAVTVIEERVRESLIALKLPVEAPSSKPRSSELSPFDSALFSNTLVLPLEGGTVFAAPSGVSTLDQNGVRPLAVDESLRFGQVLFVEESAELRISVSGALYQTPEHGMERPLPLKNDSQAANPRSVWIVIVNGPSAAALSPFTGEPIASDAPFQTSNAVSAWTPDESGYVP